MGDSNLNELVDEIVEFTKFNLFPITYEKIKYIFIKIIEIDQDTGCYYDLDNIINEIYEENNENEKNRSLLTTSSMSYSYKNSSNITQNEFDSYGDNISFSHSEKETTDDNEKYIIDKIANKIFMTIESKDINVRDFLRKYNEKITNCY